MSVHDDQKALEEDLSILKGATIIDTRVDVEDDFGYQQLWPVLIVEVKNDKISVISELAISQDFEQNGPGAIIGLMETKQILDGEGNDNGE